MNLKPVSAAANLGKNIGNLQFLVRWIGCDELDLISGPEMNEKAPERVLEYYASISPINRRFETKEKERLALALRPTIVSKVEHMIQNESAGSDDLFRAIVQEATEEEPIPATENPDTSTENSSAMVQIPPDFNTDGETLQAQTQLHEDTSGGWPSEEQSLVVEETVV